MVVYDDMGRGQENDQEAAKRLLPTPSPPPAHRRRVKPGSTREDPEEQEKGSQIPCGSRGLRMTPRSRGHSGRVLGVREKGRRLRKGWSEPHKSEI